MKEKILGVAIQHNGTIYKKPAPKRHFHLLHEMAKWDNGILVSSIAAGQQGFYTDQREFIDRREAKRVARASGQNLRDSGPPQVLFSEDVW